MLVFIFSGVYADDEDETDAVETFEDSVTVKALIVAPIRGLQIRFDKNGGIRFIGTRYNYLGLRFDSSLLPAGTEGDYTPEADRF